MVKQQLASHDRAYEEEMERRQKKREEEQQLRRGQQERLACADEKKAAQTQEICALLERASRQLDGWEGADTSLARQLDTLQQNFALFGPSDQLEEQLRHFCDTTLPALRKQRVREVRQARFSSPAAEFAGAASTGHEFVSLHMNEEKEPACGQDGAWLRFLERLQALRQTQRMIGTIRAEELLGQAAQFAPEQRNWFLLQTEEELLEMEREAELFQTIWQKKQDQAEEMRLDYLAACALCEVRPQDTTDWPPHTVERETQRLLETHQRLRERQYVTHAFSQVLGQYGIEFEEMQEVDAGRIELRYSMKDSADIRVIRSDAGAFEMEFLGTINEEEASRDARRAITEKAHAFCRLLPEISRKLKEKGILFDQTAIRQPSEETVRIVSRRRGNRRVGRNEQKEMHS